MTKPPAAYTAPETFRYPHSRFCLLAPALLPAAAPAQDDNHPKSPSPYDSAHFSWCQPVPRNRLRPYAPTATASPKARLRWMQGIFNSKPTPPG